MICLPRLLLFTLLSVLPVAAAGCAHINARPDYDRAAELITTATGVAEVPAVDDDAERVATCEAMLKDGLMLEEVVKLALLNSPAIRAEFLEIGVARADLVQSGLFSNPTFGLSVQFPEGGGRSNLQGNIAQNIVDLWQIPVKKEIASRNLKSAILRVADAAVRLAAQARSAFFITVGARQARAIAEENVSLAQRLMEVAEARKQAGAVGDLDVNLARGGLLAARIEVQRASLAAALAEADLAQILGLRTNLDTVDLSTPLPLPPETALNTDAIIQLAVDSRLDLKAAAMNVDTAERQVVLEIRKIIPSFQIGLAVERNERRALQGRNLFAETTRATIKNGVLSPPDFQTRGERNQERSAEIDAIFGPSLSVTLPIFDQNQAQIARARFAYEKELRRWEALEVTAMQSIRRAVVSAQTSWDIARSFARDVLPQAARNLEMSRESYKAGRSSLIIVLDAQRVLLEARSGYVAALQTAAVNVADLEQASARPISEILKHGIAPVTTTQSSDDLPQTADER